MGCFGFKLVNLGHMDFDLGCTLFGLIAARDFCRPVIGFVCLLTPK